ncbi:MAG: glutamate-5-semialdehyde dehydrogenase [Clostridia bacterium]|nr:glutamate-5-semialdehyde dehydrogenase [Clostridia bacterium]
MTATLQLLKNVKAAKTALALAGTEKKDRALEEMAACLWEDREEILAANREDVEEAKGKISDVMIDRLSLTEQRIKGMADGIRDVVSLPDPVGKVQSRTERPNGLLIEKVGVPMGVIGLIYESRPNVTSDAAALTVKAGSGCILRCGKEAHRSCAAIVRAMRRGLAKAGLPEDAVVLVEDITRQSVTDMMTAKGYIDLLIPRGGAGLIKAVTDNAQVPVIQTGTGICHIYVDSYKDPKEALDIIENAKCSRPSVCNAEEVCLVKREIAKEFLPLLRERLVAGRVARNLHPVQLILDEEAGGIISGTKAGPEDFDTEFLDYKLAVAVVKDVGEACEHIARHSTGHSESILTTSAEAADLFTSAVDSAAVYVNASTRFTDGGEFGLGCEIGISTQKFHARGPMGLDEICSYKYVIRGSGQIR